MNEQIRDRPYGWALARMYKSRFGLHADQFREPVKQLAEADGRSHERSLLDLCCGTGDWLSFFVEAGYRAVGIDLSRSMLHVARKQLTDHVPTGEVVLVNCDCRRFAVRRPAALVTCMGGANHLNGLDELGSMLRCAYDAARPDALLVFDLFLRKGLESWNGISVIESDTEIVIVRGHYEAGRMALAKISGAIGDDPEHLHRFEEVQAYYEFDVHEAVSCAEASGWTAYAALPNDLSTPGTDFSDSPIAFVVGRRS